MLAFAGIGHPEKFFDTVAGMGGNIVARREFPDHHFYTDEDARDLLRAARKSGSRLVTTEKDAVRLLRGSDELRALAEAAAVVEIEVRFELDVTAAAIIRETLAAWRRRREALV